MGSSFDSADFDKKKLTFFAPQLVLLRANTMLSAMQCSTSDWHMQSYASFFVVYL
jgi:hypothetical protein